MRLSALEQAALRDKVARARLAQQVQQEREAKAKAMEGLYVPLAPQPAEPLSADDDLADGDSTT